ncbi:MAG: single-stranded DNA-binding protein [Flavobacteriaceae bacterium]|nr:single-stranded DNA-binding protein [Flavobacteriaceae bacterium]
MAGTINKVILIGNLGDDVKMHYFDGGNSIGRFPIATSETYTNRQTGEKVTNTDWHNIVVKNKLAEICEKYLTKGDKIYIEGKLKNRQWEQDGVKRYATEVHVSEMTMLSNKKNENNAMAQQNQEPSSQPKSMVEDEDDLPF